MPKLSLLHILFILYKSVAMWDSFSAQRIVVVNEISRNTWCLLWTLPGTGMFSLLPHSIDQVYHINPNISRTEKYVLPLVVKLSSHGKGCGCVNLFKVSCGESTAMIQYYTKERRIMPLLFGISYVFPSYHFCASNCDFVLWKRLIFGNTKKSLQDMVLGLARYLRKCKGT